MIQCLGNGIICLFFIAYYWSLQFCPSVSYPEMALTAYSMYSSHLTQDPRISDASSQLLILSRNILHDFQTHVHATLWTIGAWNSYTPRRPPLVRTLWGLDFPLLGSTVREQRDWLPEIENLRHTLSMSWHHSQPECLLHLPLLWWARGVAVFQQNLPQKSQTIRY